MRRGPARRDPTTASAGRARSGLRLAGLLALVLGPGCTLAVPRGPLSDFFIKDHDLPDYRPSEARFHRARREVMPSAPSGSLGGMSGAVAGGRLQAWPNSGGGSLGGMAGAVTAAAYRRTEALDPLPEEYSVLSLALPVISTDPNKGPTVGLLPVIVMREGARITDIFAPDLTWNEIDGPAATFRMRRFFSSDAALALDAGSSLEGAHDYDVLFTQRRLGPRRFLFYRARFRYTTSLSNRFYGLGAEADEDDESTYVFRQTLGEASLGLELPLNLTAEFQERISSYKVGPGRLDDVPSSRALFGGVPGMTDPRLTVLTHRITLTYDTRDSATAPTQGMFGQFSYDIGDETLGSDVAFQRFSAAFTALIPKLGKRLITVLHLAGWYLKGRRVPFYEQTTIGGKSTLRGFGAGRFYDDHGFVANIEERWNLIEFELMGVRNILQLAGFVDVGRVYDRDESLTLDDLEVAFGAAIRLLVPDSELVTSIDLGFSDEGSAVFVGLGYPF